MSTSYEMTGTVVLITPEQRFSEKFAKKAIRIDNGNKYDNIVEFEFVNDKMILVEDHMMGNEITIHFNVCGRVHNERCFTSLKGWRIISEGATPVAQGASGTPDRPSPNPANDDLPF